MIEATNPQTHPNVRKDLKLNENMMRLFTDPTEQLQNMDECKNEQTRHTPSITNLYLLFRNMLEQ